MARRIGLEDWSTLRIVCDECSRGNPGPYNCKARKSEDGTRSFGLAAENYEDAVRVLANGQRSAIVLISGIWKPCSTHASIEPSSLVLNERKLSL
jgi:hypothetical protein